MTPLGPAGIPLPTSIASGPSRRTGPDGMSNGVGPEIELLEYPRLTQSL